MRTDVNRARTEFSLYKSQLIADGALREIYQGEKATVYSLADSCYGIVIFAQKPAKGNEFYLLHCGLQDIGTYINDEDILASMFEHKLNVTNEVYNFDAKYDAALAKMNLKRIQTGFTRIDLAKEEKLLNSLGMKK